MTAMLRADLKAANSTDFQDNVAKLISPEDVRSQMDDTADSALFPEDIAGLDLSDAEVTSEGSVTKSLSEWAEDIVTGGGGGLAVKGSVPDVGSLPDDATPGDVWVVTSFDPDHLFMWDGTIWVDLGEGGSSDFNYGTAGAISWPITDRMKDQVYLLDFIPEAEHVAIRAGTSTYDASPAFTNAMASITVSHGAVGAGGPEIILPYGKVHFESPLQLTKTIVLRGHGCGGPGIAPTILEFAANQHGIIVHGVQTWGLNGGAPVWNTVKFNVDDHCYRVLTTGTNIYKCIVAGAGNCANAPSHSSGDVTGADGYTWRLEIFDNGQGNASTLRGFQMSSLGVRGVNTGHGLWVRAKVYVEDVAIYKFPENGIHLVADVHGQGELGGNANTCRFTHMRLVLNGKHGIYTNLGDSNACLFQAIDSSSNWGCGVYDSSFLGNTYVMTHTAGNGTGAQVHYAGNHYYVGDEALASTTVPGTNANAWILIGAGGISSTYPDWVSGTPYIYGNAIRADGINNICGGFFGLYMESGQNPPYLASSWTVFSSGWPGGTGTGFKIGTATGTGRLSQFQVITDPNTNTPAGFSTFIGSTDNTALSFSATGDFVWDFNLLTDRSWAFQWANSAGGIPIRFTNSLSSTLLGGRTTQIPGGNIILSQGMWIGNPYRYLSAIQTFPATGTYVAGDILFNSTPAGVSSPTGWECTTTGAISTTAWVANTAYVVSDLRLNAGNTYVCIDAGISAPTTAWVASTTYAIGACRTNGGNTYVCTKAGVSASSGGPTGTGFGIVDGTVNWDYLNPITGDTPTSWGLDTTYIVGQIVENASALLYRCDIAGRSAAGVAWAASTVYAVGSMRANGGNSYKVTAVTGDATSASSGGPSGTGTGIVDGNVTWAYQSDTDGPNSTTVSQVDGEARWQPITVTADTGTGPSGTGLYIIDGTVVWTYKPPYVLTPIDGKLSQQTVVATAGAGVAFTLTPGTSPRNTLFTGTMTADKTVTLTTTSANAGGMLKITRTAAGAFNLLVGTGPLKSMPANSWAEFTYDGTAWYLSAYGLL